MSLSEDIFFKIMSKITVGLPEQDISSINDSEIKTKLYRSELESQIKEKREAERRRRELEDLEEKKLNTRIQEDRDKIRREYLEDLKKRARMETNSVKRFSTSTPVSEISRIREDDARLKQQSIARKLEEIRVEEAKRRDEEEVLKKRLLLESLYSKDFNSKFLENPPRISSYYFNRPWNSHDYTYKNYNNFKKEPFWTYRDMERSLEEIYAHAPLTQLAEVYRNLESERNKLREYIRRRIIEDRDL